MVRIKVHSYKRDINVIVDVTNIPDKSYDLIRENFLGLLKEKKAYEAIADAYVYAVDIVSGCKPKRYLAAHSIQNIH